jgi:hypothetical protein
MGFDPGSALAMTLSEIEHWHARGAAFLERRKKGG